MFPRIAAALLAFTLTSLAANPPPDVAGMRWGASEQDAASALTSRGASFDKKASKPGRPVFGGGTFAGQPVHHWSLDFAGGKFVGMLVVLESPGKDEQAFRKLKQELNEKYGTAADSQVGHRKAPHWVFGLGWRDSGVKAPSLHAEWETESLLDHRTVAINLWVENGRVHLAYADESAKAKAGAGGKKGDL